MERIPYGLFESKEEALRVVKILARDGLHPWMVEGYKTEDGSVWWAVGFTETPL